MGYLLLLSSLHHPGIMKGESNNFKVIKSGIKMPYKIKSPQSNAKKKPLHQLVRTSVSPPDGVRESTIGLLVEGMDGMKYK